MEAFGIRLLRGHKLAYANGRTHTADTTGQPNADILVPFFMGSTKLDSECLYMYDYANCNKHEAFYTHTPYLKSNKNAIEYLLVLFYLYR